jgi:predicted kinase
MIDPPPPQLIAVGGLSGTGKSVLARALGPHILPEPGALVLRSDVQRKTLFKVAEIEKLPAEAYTPEVTARIYETLAGKAQRALAAGHSVIVDAVFARPRERAPLEELARKIQVNFHGLFLTADLATRMARVGKRVNDASDADAKVAKSQEDYDLSALTWEKVDASETPEKTLDNARHILARKS